MFLPFSIDRDDLDPDSERIPFLVYSLLCAYAAVHLYLFMQLGAGARTDVFYRFGASRFDFRWWSPLTCTFLHGSWLHLIGNLFFLWLYGRPVERSFGHSGFLLLYAGGAYVSIGIHLLTVSVLFADEPAIGASGAISAVLGAFLVCWPGARLRCLFFSILSFRPIVVVAPAWSVLGIWFLGQLAYSLNLAGNLAHVAFWAHVGGFAGGASAAYAVVAWAGVRERQARKACLRPLEDAWHAWVSGRPVEAGAALSELDDSLVDDRDGLCEFLKGVAAAELPGGTAEAADALLRSFAKARDYRRLPAVVTAYQAICTHCGPEAAPAPVHRDAGLDAFSLGYRGLALLAFDRALALGCTEGLGLMERAVRALARKRGSAAVGNGSDHGVDDLVEGDK
jgi:membrane associated rhomboid family serine protease